MAGEYVPQENRVSDLLYQGLQYIPHALSAIHGYLGGPPSTTGWGRGGRPLPQPAVQTPPQDSAKPAPGVRKVADFPGFTTHTAGGFAVPIPFPGNLEVKGGGGFKSVGTAPAAAAPAAAIPGVGLEQDTMTEGVHRPYTGVPEWVSRQAGRNVGFGEYANMRGANPGVPIGAKSIADIPRPQPAGYAPGFWPGDAPGAKAYPGMAQYRPPNMPSGVNEMRGGHLSYSGQPTFSPDEYAKILAAQAHATTARAHETSAQTEKSKQERAALVTPQQELAAGLAARPGSAEQYQAAQKAIAGEPPVLEWRPEEGYAALENAALKARLHPGSKEGKAAMRKAIDDWGSNLHHMWGTLWNMTGSRTPQHDRLASLFPEIVGESK